MLTKLAGFLLLLLAFGAAQANADSGYEFIGTLTLPGNSANPGVGETINFTVELDTPVARCYLRSWEHRYSIPLVRWGRICFRREELGLATYPSSVMR
jgi:hypothetical protein